MNYNSGLVSFRAIILAAGITLLPKDSLDAQVQVSPKAAPVITIMATDTISVLISSMKLKVATLEKQVQDLQKPWIILLTPYAWPFIVFLFGAILVRPIYKVLLSIGVKVKASNWIKLWAFEASGSSDWSRSDLERVIIEREKLKFGIAVAYVDETMAPKEIDLLFHEIGSMVDNTNKISENAKKEILQASVNMAIIDGILKKKEFEILKNKTIGFNILETELAKMIEGFIIQRGTQVDDDLKSEFAIWKNSLIK